MKDFGEWQLARCPLPNETMSLKQQQGFANGTTKWTDPEVVNWFKAYGDMVQKGWFNADAPAITQTPDAEGMFISGKAPFIVGFVADIEDYATIGPAIGVKNLGAAAFPAIEQGNPYSRRWPWSAPEDRASFGDGVRALCLEQAPVGSTDLDPIRRQQANQQAYLEQVGVPARLRVEYEIRGGEAHRRSLISRT